MLITFIIYGHNPTELPKGGHIPPYATVYARERTSRIKGNRAGETQSRAGRRHGIHRKLLEPGESTCLQIIHAVMQCATHDFLFLTFHVAHMIVR